MNHFDRLMQRAMALPRAAGPVLFDPFEQGAPAEPMVAPAPYIPATATPQATSTQVQGAPNLPQATPTGALPKPGATTVLPLPPQVNAAAVLIARTSSLPQPHAALPKPEGAAPKPMDALARADQFMRELGVPGVSRTAPAMTARTASEVPIAQDVGRQPESPPARAVLRHAPNDAASPAQTPRLEPSAPVHRSEPRPRPHAVSAQSKAAAEAAVPPIDVRQPAPAAAPPAATVLVQAVSRSLWVDELERLGRDTPMARFGVGQR